MSLLKSLLVTANFLIFTLAIGQQQIITFNASAGSFQLAGNGTKGQFLVSENDSWGVIRAAADLCYDFGRVTGQNLSLVAYGGATTAPVYTFRPPTSNVNYTVGPVENITGPAYTSTFSSNSSSKPVIVAGTIGSSHAIDSLISNGHLNVSAVTNKWEAFTTQLIANPFPGVAKALVIAGSDPRGTIYGIYDISEQIGVSPWYWFADVAVAPQSNIWVSSESRVKIQGSPSVKYRGLFINDEQPGLTNWINANYEPGPYGPGFNHYFYSRVFELLLRLRANYFWPAMWASMFNVDDYTNQPLADAYGIVMGSSHTEPMMRATNEWNNFGEGEWEWDTNNASIYPFFIYGAQRTAPYADNSLFTMAMRGSGDTAITLSQDQAIKVLEDAVSAQRGIIADIYGNSTGVPQMWCLYKEVQGYYEAGLTVPDDITLLWSDDNWGNPRRLPLPAETNRSGGAGVYYHFDYVGDPRDYKWINTIQLENTWEKMSLAYERGAERIWIVNVGDLKNLEVPISHFFDLAYDVPRWGLGSVSEWLVLWSTREFGAAVAEDAASVMDKYGRLAARRKYELLLPSTYSVINYNEAENVLAEWDQLSTAANEIYNRLDSSAQTAFFELVLHPVLAGAIVNRIYIGVGQNALFVEQKRTATNNDAYGIIADLTKDANLTQKYHSLLDGKWDHILDQTHLGYDYWQQPMRNTVPPLGFVQLSETSLGGALGVGVEGSMGATPGDSTYETTTTSLTLPPLSPYGASSRYIDVFSRGTSSCTWIVTPTVPYVIANPSTGTTGGANGTDTRVTIAVADWSSITQGNSTSVNIIIASSNCAWGSVSSPTIVLPLNHTVALSSFSGFIEDDAYVAIEAEHTTSNTSTTDASYAIIPNYGRTLSGVTLVPLTASSQTTSGPYLQYDFYTFTTTTSDAPANITLHLSPSLNFNSDASPLRYAVSVDDEEPQVVQFVSNTTGGALPMGWSGAVSDAVWGVSGDSTTTKHAIAEGAHSLKIWALDVGVVLQRIIIDLGGVRQSYLGPPESERVSGA